MRSLVMAATYEYWRVRSLRSTWMLVAVALGSSGVVTLLIGTAAVHGNVGAPHEVRLALVSQGASFSLPFVTGSIIALVGIIGWAEEVTGDAAAATLTTFRSRPAVAGARFVAISLSSAVLAVLCCALTVVVGGFVAGWDVVGPGDGALLLQGARVVGYCVALACLAASLCVILRSHTVAAFAILLIPWLVEPLVTSIVFVLPGLQQHTASLRFLPFAAAADVLAGQPGGTYIGPPRLSLVHAVIETSLVVCLAVALACAVFSRRDPLRR